LTEYKSLEPGFRPAEPAPEVPAVPAPPKGGIATTKDNRVVLRSASGFESVPADQVAQALTEPSTRLATAEEWQKHITERETSVAAEFAREAAAQALSTAGAAARLPAMVSDLAGGPGADFLRETSAAGIRANFSAMQAAAQGEDVAAAYDDSKRRQQIYEELFPTARMVARGVGDTVAGLALAGPAGAWAGTGRTALGVGARTALVSGAEGAAQGAAEEYRRSYLENRAVDRELVIANGLVGGALSAAIGGVAGAGGKKLSDYFGAKRAAASAASKADDVAAPIGARAAATTERRVAESVDELDRPAVELENTIAESEARVAKAVEAAGVNPNAQRAAAEAAAADEAKRMQDIAGADFDPKRWADAADPKKVNPLQTFIHRRTIIENGATPELTKQLDDMISGTQEMTDLVRNAELNRAHVAGRFAKDGVDETAAIASAQTAQREFGESLAGIRASLEEQGVGGSRAAKLYFGRLAKLNTIAAKALDKVDNAADAYIARDQFRREIYKTFQQVNASVRQSADPYDALAARTLQPFVDAEYHRAAHSLFDENVWKTQGAFQMAKNGQDGWVGLIDADKVGLRNFASLKTTDYHTGQEILQADPEKVAKYLNGIDSPTLRDAQVRNLIGKRASMVKTLRDGLDLTPAQRATADRVLAASEGALQTLDNAEKVAIILNRQARLNESEKLLAQGGMTSRLMGGLAKAMAGDIRGAAALQLGGSEAIARNIQALRTQAQGSESRLIRGVLGAIESTFGTGSPNAAASAKLVRRAEQFGLLDQRAETLALRMRDQGWAISPLFRTYLQAEPTKQREMHAARREVLADLVANPEKMQKALEPVMARAMSASPQMGTQLAEETITRINRLQQALPGQTLPSLFPNAASGKQEMVSSQELRQADAMIEATIDPQSVFEDFKAGRLDYDKLRFAKVQYPEMFEVAKAIALDVFRELPADLQSNMATQLDFLLDFGGALDPTLRDDFLKRQEERFKQRQQAEQQRPAARRVPQVGEAAQTYSQRLAGA
jgi:hypothetical protein